MTSITNVDKVKKDKLFELDYMRFVACLAVIIVHITATGVTGYINGSFPHVAILFINRCFKFTTPIFIFFSGVTSFFSYRKKELKYFSFLKKRLERVLIAYLIWCVIYYVVYIKLGFYSFDLRFLLNNIFYGTMSYHLYFVIIITQMYIVGPLLYKIIKNSDKKVAILLMAAIITALSSAYMNFQYSDRFFMKYVFFYILGIYVTLEYDSFISWIKKYRVIIATGYVGFSVLYTYVSFYNLPLHMYVWFVFSIFALLFVYLVGLMAKEKFKQFYSFIKLFGQSSYYIYLMHPLVLTLAIMYTDNNYILSITKRLLIYSATVFPITIISCLVFTAIKNKIAKDKKVKATALAK